MPNVRTPSRPHGRQLGKFSPGVSGNPAGRPKGAKNRVTQELIDKLSSSGLTPLEFMTAVFRDDEQPMELRLEAAARAAPYFHAKMSVLVTVPATIRHGGELLRIAQND
jgi:hypothetical protein